MRRRDERPERPERLNRFRLAEWLADGEARRDSAVREDLDRQEWAANVVAAAYDRYRAARATWAEEHGVDRLDELMDCRRRRVAEWDAARADAAAIGGNAR